MFNIDECRVHYNGVLVLTGKRDKATGLWNLTINPSENPSAISTIENLGLHIMTNQHVPHSARNVHKLPYLQNSMKYMHQTFFCTQHSTLIAAIDNHQLKRCPFITVDNVRKYLPASPATSKGRMKRQRTGIRSTRPKQSTKEHERIVYMIPMPKGSSKIVFQETAEVFRHPTHSAPIAHPTPIINALHDIATTAPTTIPFED